MCRPCHTVDCQYNGKIYGYGGWFCHSHYMELREIRMYIHYYKNLPWKTMNSAICEKYYREEEFLMRRDVHEGHIRYIQNLEKSLNLNFGQVLCEN